MPRATAESGFYREGGDFGLPGAIAPCLGVRVIQLFHTDLGGAGLPPMLVLHGLLGSSRNWLSTGRDLARHFHVIALDARNHGKSPHDPVMNYEEMVADIIAWMDANQMGKAAIVGHSMGGKTAMLLACLHPERVERLVVVDIAPKDYNWAAHKGEFLAMNELDLLSLKSRAEAEIRFEARVPHLGTRKFLATNLDRGEEGKWKWTINLPVLTELLSLIEKNSLGAHHRYEGPTQFILGGRSRYAESGDHDLIRNHFPRAEIATIAESGHNPHMDSREAFVQLVVG